jgi:hypothetical protein
VRRGDISPTHPSNRFIGIQEWLGALQSLTDAITEVRTDGVRGYR